MWRGSFGPISVTTGTSSATATWRGPVSFETTSAERATSALRSARSPGGSANETISPFVRSMTSRAIEISSGSGGAAAGSVLGSFLAELESSASKASAIDAFLAEHPPPGRVFNTLDYGGYLIYALAPERRVFIDGRNDTVYDEAFFARTFEASRSASDFALATEGFDVSWAVLPWSGPGDRRFAFLHADPSWVLVDWDDAAVVLVRREERTEAYVEEHGYRELSLHDAFVRVATLGPGEADQRLAAEVRAHAERAPDSLSVMYLALLLHRRLGEQDAYVARRARFVWLAAERGLDVAPP